MLDTLMLSLRTADGLPLAHFGDTYGQEALAAILPVLQHHADRGLVLWLGGDGDWVPAAGLAHGPMNEGSVITHDSQQGGAGPSAIAGTPQLGAAHQWIEVSSSGSCAGSGNEATARSSSKGKPTLGHHAASTAPSPLPGATARLADPDGFLLSNDVISDLFAAFMPLPPSH